MLMEGRGGQRWVLKALREAGSSLVSELYGAEGHALGRRADGEWSPAQIAGHLRDAEELALAQMNALIQGARRLPAWDVDVLAEERGYSADDLPGLLAEFRSLRGQTTRLLRGLTEGEWQASAQHPYRGEVGMGEIAHELAQHDLEHLWQIRKLKRELGAVSTAEDVWD
jgi:hypothetical protein